MDLSRIYTKTSKGILDGNLRSRTLTREHGRLLALIDGKSTIADLLDKNKRLSENKLAGILDELAQAGFIRLMNAPMATEEELGFSSTIIVHEANTQAFFEAEAEAASKRRRAEDLEAEEAEKERETLLKEVKADIEAEAEVLKKRATAVKQNQATPAVGKSNKAAELKDSAPSNVLPMQKQSTVGADKQKNSKAAVATNQVSPEHRADKERLTKEAELQAQRALEAKIRLEEESLRNAEMEKRLHEIEAAKLKAQQEAQSLAKELNEAKVAAELENRVKRRIEARAREEEESRKRAEAEAKAKQEEESRKRAEMEAQLEAERKARKEAEERAKAEAEARAKAEAEAKEKLEAEKRAAEAARVKAEEEARKLAAEEARKQAEAVAAAKLEAERKAREEAEAKARAEADARAKAEEERAAAVARAKAEEEARQKAAEEARKQAEAEAAARLEAERKARLEAEEKARAEAEARAKAEAEKRVAEEARQKAEEEARKQAEAEEAAKREAEARAKAEAEENARVKAEAEKAAQEAEEARLQAETARLALLEAERQAREEAEAFAREQAEQRAMEEMRRETQERLAREAAEHALEEEREAREIAEQAARALAEERAEMERMARSRDEDRQRARDEADAKARAEMEEAMRLADAERLQEEDEEQRLRAEAEARALAAAQAAELPFLQKPKREPFRFDLRMFKSLLAGLFVLFLAGVALAHVLSISFYIPALQQQLSQSLGQPVKVQDLHFSLYPAPHWAADEVSIGDKDALRIGNVKLFPTLGSWFTSDKIVTRVELDGITLNQQNFSALPIWKQQQGKKVPLQFEQLLITNGKFAHPVLDVFGFDAKVDVKRGRFTLAQIDSTDKRFKIMLNPQSDGLHIDLNASKSVFPMEPRLPFETLKVQAVAVGDGITLSNIDAQLFDGYVSGSGKVDWAKDWQFNGELSLVQIDLPVALKQISSKVGLIGRLDAKLRIAAQAEKLETLFATPQVQATFRVKNGEFNGFDIGRAIQAQTRGGTITGKTHFTDLTGFFQTAKGHYQYRQLKMQGGVISAFGNLDIDQNLNLSGNVVGDLQTQTTRQRQAFTLTGKVESPALRLGGSVQRASAPN